MPLFFSFFSEKDQESEKSSHLSTSSPNSPGPSSPPQPSSQEAITIPGEKEMIQSSLSQKDHGETSYHNNKNGHYNHPQESNIHNTNNTIKKDFHKHSQKSVTSCPDSSLSLESKKRSIQWSFYGAMSMSLFFLLLKGFLWKKTGALTFQASFLDSVFDGLGSLMNLLLVRHALKPADEDHRFGHGKLEALSSLGQCFFAVGSCLWFFVEALSSFFSLSRHHEDFSVSSSIYILTNGLLLLTLLMNAGLLAYQRSVWKKTGSLAVKTDFLHYKSDFLMTLFIVFTFNISALSHYKILDVLVSLGLVLYLFYGAFSIGKESLHILMDRELPQKDLDLIRDIVLSHPHVLNFHDLRTRSSGHQIFIQLHLDLDPFLTLQRAHEISHEIEDLLLEHYPHGDIIIHQDPLDEVCLINKTP